MSARIQSTRTDARTATVSRGMGLAGQLVVGGTVSTALLLGGFAVSLLGLAGRTSGHAILTTSIGLFIVGAMIGLTLSAAMGLIGRDPGVTLQDAAADMAKGLLYAIPALAIGAVLAGWMAMAVIAVYLGKAGPLAGAAIAALIAGAVILATSRLAWESAQNVVRRTARIG